MNLTQFQNGQKVIISQITTDQETKNRLRSFGIDKGTHVTIHQKSPGGANVEIKCRNAFIALRKNEAEGIQCEAMA